MPYQLYKLPAQVLHAGGELQPGWKVYFYLTGTSTPTPVYTTSALSTTHTQPVEADSAGVLPLIYLDPTIVYKTRVFDENDVEQTDFNADPVNDALLSSAVIATTLDSLKRTAEEIAAGVTPSNYAYQPGDLRRYGAVGDGVTDDSQAFASAALVSHTHWMTIPRTDGGYKIVTPFVLPDNAQVIGVNKPLLFATVNGLHVCSATSVSRVAIIGVRFAGSDDATTPSTSFGGYSAANTGLFTATDCDDVFVDDCDFDNFYNCLTVQQCGRLWVEKCKITNFYLHGILASRSSVFHIDRNVIDGCTQTGGAVAYGIHATGDEAGGLATQRNSISFNKIKGIPSWDGIMSHDCDGLQIIGNDIRDVRIGIDITCFTGNFIRKLVISGNYIEGSNTDTWGGTGAMSAGISIGGDTSSSRAVGVAITGNVINSFFNATGMGSGGNPSHITILHTDDLTISGNSIYGGGSQISNAGIQMQGTCHRFAITGNTMKGTMSLAGIRFLTVTSNGGTVVGNHIEQNNSAHEGVYFSSSTISALEVGYNATNSSTPIDQSGSTLTLAGDVLEGTVTWNPPSIANGASSTTTITVNGAAFGDYVVASFNGDLSGLALNAYVSASNTVTAILLNNSGGAIDLGSATVRARVFKKLN